MSDYIEIKWPSHVITNAKPSGDQVMVLKGMSVVKGDSLYDLAVKNGEFDGSEQEYVVATDAARLAAEAAATNAATSVANAQDAATLAVNSALLLVYISAVDYAALEQKGDGVLYVTGGTV